MYMRIHVRVKNGKCKSKLEFATNMSFKGVLYIIQKIELRRQVFLLANVLMLSESRLHFKDRIIAHSGKRLQPADSTVTIFQINSYYPVERRRKCLFHRSYFGCRIATCATVLPFAAGHLHGNKVMACKMSIAK